ncbi:MAG: hypothetical protein E7352_00700 [Clostridiales bacterium]|nr:hypothetical protein [Clostridiales bacterium]
MMQKFIIGVALVAFTSFCGYFLARKYRQRKLFFKQFQEFNERFLSEIAYYRRPIREFASKYTYKGEFDMLLKDFFTTLENRAIMQAEFLDLPVYSFLKSEEKRIVEDYFLMLGKGDSASQKGYFSSVKESLARLQKESEETCKRYGDLYIKIGFLCGLLILILIL